VLKECGKNGDPLAIIKIIDNQKREWYTLGNPHLYGIWYLVLGIWCLVFGILYLVFGIWYLAFGVWYLVFGIWYLVFDI